MLSYRLVKNGIGFRFFQKHCKCEQTVPFCCIEGWKNTLVGNRFTSTAESWYSLVEGEALAVMDALKKVYYFVIGCDNLVIAVNHKPLLKHFGDRSFKNITNAWLYNLKEKTLHYKFKMLYLPGAKHCAPDTFFCNPTGDPESVDLNDDVDLNVSVS